VVKQDFISFANKFVPKMADFELGELYTFMLKK